MSLEPGSRIGPYEVVSPLGAGGMGEVYRANDSRLRRAVAIKVLPDEVARDAERLARFEREAQLLASLNHPNIASIYGIEESGGVRCLVLELIEGQTLGTRMEAGAMAPDEVVRIASQIAEGLEAAHERGIVHRDLKPANVMITPEGVVKVLDFGLAKALEMQPRISPDGRYVVYASNESGSAEVYLTRFPSGEGKWQVSVNHGLYPIWSRAGDEIFYRNDDAIMAVTVRTDPSPLLGTPQLLFKADEKGLNVRQRAFDITSDGQHLITAKPLEKATGRDQIVVVTNWYSEFEKAQ